MLNVSAVAMLIAHISAAIEEISTQDEYKAIKEAELTLTLEHLILELRAYGQQLDQLGFTGRSTCLIGWLDTPAMQVEVARIERDSAKEELVQCQAELDNAERRIKRLQHNYQIVTEQREGYYDQLKAANAECDALRLEIQKAADVLHAAEKNIALGLHNLRNKPR